MEDIKYKVILPDNIEFFIEESVVNSIPTFIQLTNNKPKDYVIQLDNIDGKIFSQIVTFIRYKMVDPNDNNFLNKQIDNMNIATLLDVILAAKYLGIYDIVDRAVERFKTVINNNTTEQMRSLLGIVSDYSEEEDAKNRIELKWEDV
jgi:hypothetical protein